jgi:hypothetical protein
VRDIDRSATVTIIFLVVLSLGLRLAIVAQAAFPLNDGGLFHAFIADLLNNNLRLPAFSTYNAAAVPLVYPPLAFYIIALLNLGLHIPALQLLQFVPAIVSVACIPAFYALASDLLSSRVQAVLATLVFALMPRTFDWLIMGGGITRSLGLLLGLLTMRQTLWLFQKRSGAFILPAVLLGGLLVCTHPEATAHTAVTAALFYIWRDRSRTGLRNAALVAVGIVAITSPWWATVLSRHGIAPYLAAAAAARQDSYNALVGLVALFRFDFTDEPFLRIFGLLGLLGLLIKLAQRDFILPVWLVLLHTFEPRGGTLYMMIPLAMAAGYFLDAAVLPILTGSTATRLGDNSMATSFDEKWLGKLRKSRQERLFLAYLALYGCVGAYVVGSKIAREITLTIADLQAFEWVRENTLPTSRFALVTQGLPLRDASSEWFPAMTNRRSVATVFGLEWVPSTDFAASTERYKSLQACSAQDTSCLDFWAEDEGDAFDYVYLRSEDTKGRTVLGDALAHSPGYERVFSNKILVIYRRK